MLRVTTSVKTQLLLYSFHLSSLLLYSFHLFSDIALYLPLIPWYLANFSECYIGIIFSGTNFVVFFKLRFSDKRFSSWPLACHKIILPVRMLRMLRTLFCRDTSFFFHTYYHLRLRCRNSTFDSSTRRLDRDAVGTCLGASISSDHFPSFENVENFVLS